MNRANDLFLLLLNLSQMRSRSKVMALFLESLGGLFAPRTFEHADRAPDGTGLRFPIATRNSAYGQVLSAGAEPLLEADQALLHNATQMLAVVLERLDFEEKLEKERSSVAQLADERLVGLQATVDQLRQSRNAYLNMVEDLNHEIDERRRIEDALRESEATFRGIFENIQDVFYETTVDGLILEISPSIGKLSREQYHREDLIGKSLRGFYANLGERGAVLEALQKRGSVTDYEITFRNRDGSTIPCSVSARMLSDAHGTPIKIIGSMRDVTERKRFEMALRQSEEKFRRTFETMPNPMTLQTMEGVLLDFNNAFCEETMGFTREELLGHTTLELGLWTDVEQRKTMGETLQREGRVDGMEIQFRRRNGQIRILQLSARLLAIDAEPLVLAVTQDITERRRAETEKARLEAQFQQAQKMESVGRLAGGVAHDFNNMLQTILGNVELAMEAVPSVSPVSESLEEIQKAALHSADLTRQLLAFARQETVAPKVLDLNEVVKSLLKMLRRLIGEDIQLAWLPAAGLGPVKMDPSQLDQILANLCVNARDAIGVVGKITIETENAVFDEACCADHPGVVPGEYVRLAVSDDGCGMDKETLALIFEPFFTTKDVGKGTGLGLATVYGIVKQNKGFIQVYSEPDKGTTFKIHLPRHAGQAAATGTEAAAELRTSHGETVFLVEDEQTILTIARKILERLGYNVLTASTPGEAIRLAKSHVGEIHLLLTDVVMPEMNGRDLAKRLLSLHPKVKCLFMSGYTADVIADHGMLDEGVQFLHKPFSMEDLAAKVREALEAE